MKIEYEVVSYFLLFINPSKPGAYFIYRVN